MWIYTKIKTAFKAVLLIVLPAKQFVNAVS